MRMIPTALMLNPEALTSTAKVRIAPVGARSRLSGCAVVFVDEPTEDVMAVEVQHCGWMPRLFAALRLLGATSRRHCCSCCDRA
jgi:hypothetical protein